MRLFRNIVLYLAAVLALYLIVLWDAWDIVLLVVAIPVGLLVLLIGLLVLVTLIAGTIKFFSSRDFFPNIRSPKNLMEAALLLQKILNTAEDPKVTDWPHFEPYNIAWAGFIFNDEEILEALFKPFIQ